MRDDITTYIGRKDYFQQNNTAKLCKNCKHYWKYMSHNYPEPCVNCVHYGE